MASTKMPESAIKAAAIGTLTVTHESDRNDGRHAGRQHVPDEHVLQGEDGVGSGGDSARQRPGHPVGEVARRMSGEMTKQITTQVPGDGDKGVAGDPAGHPPQQVIGGNQGRQQHQAEPRVAHAVRRHKPLRQRINQELHAVLRAYRAADSRQRRRLQSQHEPQVAFLCSDREVQMDAERTGKRRSCGNGTPVQLHLC